MKRHKVCRRKKRAQKWILEDKNRDRMRMVKKKAHWKQVHDKDEFRWIAEEEEVKKNPVRCTNNVMIMCHYSFILIGITFSKLSNLFTGATFSIRFYQSFLTCSFNTHRKVAHLLVSENITWSPCSTENGTFSLSLSLSHFRACFLSTIHNKYGGIKYYWVSSSERWKTLNSPH